MSTIATSIETRLYRYKHPSADESTRKQAVLLRLGENLEKLTTFHPQDSDIPVLDVSGVLKSELSYGRLGTAENLSPLEKTQQATKEVKELVFKEGVLDYQALSSYFATVNSIVREAGVNGHIGIHLIDDILEGYYEQMAEQEVHPRFKDWSTAQKAWDRCDVKTDSFGLTYLHAVIDYLRLSDTNIPVEELYQGLSEILDKTKIAPEHVAIFRTYITERGLSNRGFVNSTAELQENANLVFNLDRFARYVKSSAKAGTGF